MTFSNPCSRCGTERIAIRTWSETIGSSQVESTQKICPNPDCQQVVDRELKAQIDKKESMARQKRERIMAKKAEKDAQAAAKVAVKL